MEAGITVEEACAHKVIGTDEDFQRQCNEDGTVKSHPKTTTITLKNNSTKTVTVNNVHLQVAVACVLALILITIGLLISKHFKNTKRNNQ